MTTHPPTPTTSLVLALDIGMPGRDGLGIILELTNLQLPTRALVLSMGSDDGPAIRAIRVGATGFVNKTASLDELVEAVEAALAGARRTLCHHDDADYHDDERHCK